MAYVCLLGGLYYFVINRIERKSDISNILSQAIPFGLCVFGFFDFINTAIFKNYDLTTAFIDLAWGITNCCITSTLVSYCREP